MGSVFTRAPPLSTSDELCACPADGPLFGDAAIPSVGDSTQNRIPVTPVDMALIPAGADTKCAEVDASVVTVAPSTLSMRDTLSLRSFQYR